MKEDLDIAVAGLRFTRRIMAANALARFEPEEWKPGPEVESDEDLESIGFWDLFAQEKSWFFVEWGDRLPSSSIPLNWGLWKINIQKNENESRHLTWEKTR